MNLLKVNASELAIATVMSALQAAGLSGYRNDTEFSVGRHLRDVLSSPIMINNDRILANVATSSLLEPPSPCDTAGLRGGSLGGGTVSFTLKRSTAARGRHDHEHRGQEPARAARPARRRSLPTRCSSRWASTASMRAPPCTRRWSSGLTAPDHREHREPGTEVLRFPPVMSRAQLEKSGYLKSFPNLLGCVSCLHGSEADIRARRRTVRAGRRLDARRWRPPISCSARPPAIRSIRWRRAAARCPAGGLIFDVACDCFRHEPSKHLDRLQSFRMREYVCIGSADADRKFRERWMTRAQGIADRARPALRVEPGERSVLRPRRQDDGDEPDASSR